MKVLSRLVAATAATAAAAGLVLAASTPALASSARAPSHPSRRGAGVVFVQNDNPNGNAVVAYERAPDGSLSQRATYSTHGKGGVLDGSVVDHLASQGSLAYDARHGLLFAVNAGSNTVSVFAVHGARLQLREVLPSGGHFPVSVAIHDHLVYVLNALDGATVQGYAVVGDFVFPIPVAHRALGLDPNATPQFTTTPGQVAFSPDGSKLVVTTKGNTSAIDVLRVGPFGVLSAPVVNSLPNAVPFAVTFDAAERLVVSEAGPNAGATFVLHGNGTVTPIGSAATGQLATCWIVGVNGRFFLSNAASGTLSTIVLDAAGHPTLTATTGTDGGTVDAAATPDGHFLYVQAGANGVVDGFRVNGDGSLTSVGSVTVPNGAGGEGIVAI
jgi:6-phosphogluconolactonase (cycloisomerase 2 family)